MKRLLFISTCFLLVLAPVGNARAQAAASSNPAIQGGGETAAKTAADAWLAQVDEGRYEPAYLSTAGIFQKIVAKEQWSKMAASGRGVMGKVRFRTVKDSKSTTTMPGAPEGQYVVIHYDASFEKKTAAVETLTMVLDADGGWKACGYFIR